MSFTFKEVLQLDIDQTFMDPDEFGEEHLVDGKMMNIIIDNNEMIDREKRTTKMGEGLFNKQVLFYVSEKTFGNLPKIGRQLLLDKKKYKIMDAINESGIFSISLEVIRS